MDWFTSISNINIKYDQCFPLCKNWFYWLFLHGNNVNISAFVVHIFSLYHQKF